MADSDTNNNSLENVTFFIGEEIFWIILGLTLTGSIYGVTSWYFVKKFRHFRNYVFISANIVRMLTLFLLFSTDLSPESLTIEILEVHVYTTVIMMYCELSFRYWLLVLCYVFYVEFVKIFTPDIPRRYLKSSLFAWGVPFISTVLSFVPMLFYYFYDTSKVMTQYMLYFLIYSMLFVPVAISFVIYITVLYSLFRGSEASASTSPNKWRRFYIATLIFVLSNVIVLPVVIEVIGVKIYTIIAIMELGATLNIIALPVYLIISKSNRELWREFLEKKSKQISLGMK